jgi:drug/metabolite transporter (DMT)-like permease
LTPARALVAVHAAVLLFGFAGLFGRWLDLSPVAIVIGRTAIAAAALAVVRRQAGRGHSRFDLRLLANGAVLALHWVAFFAAVQAAGVAIGLLGYASFPLFVPLLERVMLGRRATGREIGTAVAVAVGLALLVPEPSLANPVVRGLAWGIVSGMSFALLAVLNRRYAATRRATDIAFWQNLCATAVLLPFAFARHASLGSIGAREILLLLALGLACTALAHTLFIASLRAITAHTAATVAALEPVYGTALAALLLGEVPTARTLAGGALVVGAALLATGRAAGQGGGARREPVASQLAGRGSRAGRGANSRRSRDRGKDAR